MGGRGAVRRIAVLAGVALVCATGVSGAAQAAAGGATPTDGAATAGTATVGVDATQQLATVPSTGIGLNASTYDSYVSDASVPGLVRAAGVGLMRFPGGTESDEYDWRTNTDVLSGDAQATDFDQFMAMAGKARVQPMITVNYGTGDTLGATRSPAETGAQVAADWVRYANVQHHYHVRYWEIGNEVYGNDTYGAYWEPDDHCGAVPPASQPTTCGPDVYARTVARYVAAMKAVDPSIKVGVVLTAPGSWPDGQTAPGSPQPWNQTVLSALGGSVDFADVHWYPQNPSNVTPPGPTDAGLLADTDQIPGIVSTLRDEFAQYAGDRGLPIMLTETNSVSSNPGKQTTSTVNALYLEQDYLGWLTAGVSNVDWWQLHNGIVTTGDNGSDLFGTTNYGDYGVLSDATCGTSGGTQVCEPKAETPFPAYNGLALLGRFVDPGDGLLATSSDQPLLRAYAARAGGGALRVMLVNDSPDTSYTVDLGYTGFTPAPGTPRVSSLSGDGSAIAAGHQGSAGSQTVPPYSVTVVTLSPAR